MATHKLQVIKDKNGTLSKYFITLPKVIVESLGWKKGNLIDINLTTQYSEIKLLVEKSKKEQN